MGFSLRGFSSHEGVRHAVLRAALAVAGLVVALELAGAPAVVQRAVAAALLAELHVIVDHLVGICAGDAEPVQWGLRKDTSCIWRRDGTRVLGECESERLVGRAAANEATLTKM